MKKVLAWLLRIVCILVIAAAVFTLVRCILHMNDDHSDVAVMESSAVTSLAPAQPAESTDPLPEPSETPAVDEEPTILLTALGEGPEVTVTATFGNIQESVKATISWALNGQVVNEEPEQLLVNGTARAWTFTVDPEAGTDPVASVTITFGDKTASAELPLPSQAAEEEPEPEEPEIVTIRTAEITVTAEESCTVFEDSDLTDDSGEIFYAGETALLRDYEYPEEGLDALLLQFTDGSTGWVSARRCQITTADCTTDADYTQAQKETFVNGGEYTSDTEYLVWVSLYTQKVNVFSGKKGQWVLEKSFDCATGINSTPTITGAFRVTSTAERWYLGEDAYVEPVLVFNGGAGITSQPYSADTDRVIDSTMGRPASGGSVRLVPEDIEWLYETIPVGTSVIVF